MHGSQTKENAKDFTDELKDTAWIIKREQRCLINMYVVRRFWRKYQMGGAKNTALYLTTRPGSHCNK